MFEISNQQTQVNHVFEQVREREIEAIVGQVQLSEAPVPSANLSEPENVKDAVQHLSPEDVVKSRIIQSLREDKDNSSLEDWLNEYLAIGQRAHAAKDEFTHYLTPEQNDRAQFTRVSVTEYLYEFEQLDYATSLTLTNDDTGKTSELSLSLSYSRELEIERSLSMTLAEFQDPLVLNVSNKASLFDDDQSAFDINADGQDELLLKLNEGVWYLAYDKNMNGKIDNGSELFGGTTGNGFAELAEFDEDKNQVIDRDDSAFTKLSLWDGGSRFSNLKQSGIAGISLFSEQTPFTFTDNRGDPIARIRQTGIFISDKNTLGAVHQVDIAV